MQSNLVTIKSTLIALITAGLAVMSNPLLAQTNTDGGSSHRDCTEQALLDAVTAGEKSGTITLEGNCRYVLKTLHLREAWLNGGIRVDKASRIDGNGAILYREDSAPQFRFFILTGGAKEISNLTLRGGYNWQHGGGAIYSNASSVSLKKVVFDRNKSNAGGGAVHLSNGSLTIESGEFTGNEAIAGNGGAIDMVGGTLTVSSSRFTNNAAGSGDGGAIRKARGNLTVANSQFVNNQSKETGGALYTSAVTTLTDTELKDNESAKEGGAINSDNSLSLKNVTINNNSSGDSGGAIRAWGSLALDRAKLTNNRAKNDGGAIHSLALLAVSNSIFANNRVSETPGNGAAIYLSVPNNNASAGAHDISSTTIVDNDRNMGTAITSHHETRVVNTIIANHHFALNFNSQAGSTEAHNLFVGNTSIERNRQPASTSVVVASAGFTNAEQFDYSLTRYSPAIDKGLSDDVSASDIENLPRPFNAGRVDIGAHEFQGKGGPALWISQEGPFFIEKNVTADFELTVGNSGIEDASGLTATVELPPGAEYVSGSASDGGQYSDGQIVWNLGSLAAGSEVYRQYQVIPSSTLRSRNYRVESVDDASLSAIGKTLETPLKPDLVALSGFFPRYDGFRFQNWGVNPEPQSDLTVADIEKIFGRDAACKNVDQNSTCELRATASNWRNKWLRFVSKGHCAGMAMASLDLFANPATTPQFVLGESQSFYQTRKTNSALALQEFQALPERSRQQQPRRTFDLKKPEARRMVTLYAATQVETPVDEIILLANGISRRGTDVVDSLDTIVDMTSKVAAKLPGAPKVTPVRSHSHNLRRARRATPRYRRIPSCETPVRKEKNTRWFKLHFRQNDGFGGGGERSVIIDSFAKLKSDDSDHPFAVNSNESSADIYKFTTYNSVQRNKTEENKKIKRGLSVQNQQSGNRLTIFVNKSTGQWLATESNKHKVSLPGYGGQNSAPLYMTHDSPVTPTGILNLLIKNLSDTDAEDRYRLSFSKHPCDGGGSGHTVVPFAVERLGQSQNYLIHIYENNRPNEFDLAVKINRQTGDWSYVAQTNPSQPMHGYRGNNLTDNLLLTSWLTSTSFPKCLPEAYCDWHITAATGQVDDLQPVDDNKTPSDTVMVALNGEGSSMITRSDGKRVGIDPDTGLFVSEIEGAERHEAAFGLSTNVPPLIEIPHQPGMQYSVQVQASESAFGASSQQAELTISGPGLAASVKGIYLSLATVDNSDSARPVAPEVGFDPEQTALRVNGGFGQSESIDLALAIDQDDGADITTEVSGVNISQAQDVRLTFDESTQGLSVAQGGNNGDSVTLEVKRINFDGTTDTHKTQTVLASGGTPLQVGLGEEWQAGQTPVIRGAGLLSGSVVFTSVNYPDRVLSAEPDGSVQLLPRDPQRSDTAVFVVEPSPLGDQLVTLRTASGFVVATPDGVQLRADAGDLARASFSVHSPGLAGSGSSFESAAFADHYLRHSSFVLRLHAIEDAELYRQDTSFIVSPAE